MDIVAAAQVGDGACAFDDLGDIRPGNRQTGQERIITDVEEEAPNVADIRAGDDLQLKLDGGGGQL